MLRSLYDFLGLSAVILMLLLSTQFQHVHAQAPSELSHAMSNREVCLYFKQHGAEIRGASLEQLLALCKKNNVIINHINKIK